MKTKLRIETNPIENKYNQNCTTCQTNCSLQGTDRHLICEDYNNPDIYADDKNTIEDID